MAAKRRVIYATSGWCIHDTRWFAALEDNGLASLGMSITDDPGSLPPGVLAVDSPEALRAKVDELARDASQTGGLSILAGPLTTVTRHLVGVDARLVGLSWGWDLQPEAIGGVFDPGELAWVSHLDALIVDSIVTQEVAIQLGLDPSRITNIPWGIDTDLFTPEGRKADLSVWGVSPGDRVILSLRSHTAIHRVGDIIEAFALALPKDPDLFLLIAAGGPHLPQHVAEVHELGISERVRFTGTLAESDLPALLRSVDASVSATAVDGSAVSLLQALACATYVIASDIPGGRLWYAPATTGTFQVGNVMALSDVLAGLHHGGIDKATLIAQASRVRRLANWRRNSAALEAIMVGNKPTSVVSPGP